MPKVETVTGPVEADELGTTLVHEHLIFRDEAVWAQWPHAESEWQPSPGRSEPIGGDGLYDAALASARAVVERGCTTIFDPTCMFGGRDVEFCRRVSEETGLRVVPCTGIYTYDWLPMFLLTRDVDAMAELFVHDIEAGIQGTGIKAAFIKCAADEPGVTENVEKVHRAAARASVRTGAPIMAHSRPASETAFRQIEIFEQEGVELERVQIAHTGDSDDLDYIERVLEKGVWIGMDRYGLDLFLATERRNATLLALLERGHAERMHLSQDYCATIDWYPAAAAQQLIEAGALDGWSMTLIFDRVLPELRERGLSEEQERTMLVENPRRWITA